MSKHLERDLESLERDLLAQSSVVEQMIRAACRGLRQRDSGVAAELGELEPGVNSREVRIEEECLKLLALHQPVAVDLRRVATVLKVNSDLERIADLAVNIGERIPAIASRPDLRVSGSLDEMAAMTIGMVRDALDALVEFDADLARKVCRQDDEVDEYNRTIIAELHEVMQHNGQLVEAALHFFSASRHIERIADHATNIAEDVIYLVEGEITRHQSEEERRASIDQRSAR
ncbi:MAG: phosphate signaling complex protein PhoU [Planctomycetota bacterium]